MLAMTYGTLLVLMVVLAAIAIRYATEYTPESPLRLWATRVAVITIILWFTVGLIGGAARPHPFHDYWTSRSVFRGIAAIVVVWFAFRDEL